MSIKEKITQALIESVKKHLNLQHYKVFYFGSQVNGDATSRSDFDVGIDAGKKISSETKLDIQQDMDNLPVMQKIEIVDFSQVDSEFKKVALKNIEVIYER
ncbi:hypothetical protein A2230_01865 [candidate division WOR-1 bacterium RIFOXYA2_FULL_36_21]|uniref:Polymerase beta nucleotidyltransferase domain-containing protein n=1 Tax=candidate division WOR-1 bacterium RIFOXYB2_FULL_36_35 TaxID=1802578 RepID=A0A1F4S7F9_UNCSA|nr:MAG: hypothetical protein A2230_01865 [candidate division WOR-1 bacterium RIFOXYA2_FULL_36_21]OGC16107.1 MAG: hypothetical protein A2282_05545 [candidate division WOR-1 bacterium RIFOXYA12_FULL_36_13]OGC16354.1 MAG: hypothetical protein A2290_04590 [candidate division WOR-1 bacterium RIFOXYB2_FULL_36_35]